jgi:mono/diheme cytochrome c family protein
MPAWTKLSRAEREQLVSYLKTFSRFFETEAAPTALDLGDAPGATQERIAAGKQLYDRIECWKCHGREGRGDGPSAPTQEDEAKQPIRPANLTQNWLFNGGGTVEDIYARLRTGIDGTPMPSFSDLIDAGLLTEDSLWNIAHYVRSLSPEKTPEASEVIRAALTVGDLPQSPTDPAWERVEAAYVPLVGQIIARPRWFAPTINSVWVQAMHNGRDIAIRLSWDDPSRSPDPAWEEWRARVTTAMEPKDAPPAEGPLPDAFTVQFPTRLDPRPARWSATCAS